MIKAKIELFVSKLVAAGKKSAAVEYAKKWLAGGAKSAFKGHELEILKVLSFELGV